MVEKGNSKLTLEEVAKEAGVSKGGLLHHFKSKEMLIEEMLRFAISKIDEGFKSFYDKEPEGKGRFLRAYIKSSLDESSCDGEIFFSKQLWSVFLSSMFENHSLIEIFKDSFLHNQEMINQDGIDPINILIIRLAVDGLMINEMFHNPCCNDETREKVIKRLLDMTI
ncbi:MAG: TetR/AcrR family transcriptional regulator [Candidatus Sericytochromatia bacterium]